MKTYQSFIVYLFLIIVFITGIEAGKLVYQLEIKDMIQKVNYGQWGKDFLIYSDNAGFGFQVNDKHYDIMTFETLKFLINSQVFFDCKEKIK
jgi:hypothetical protein